MKSAGLRITGDYRSEKLGAKIREGRFDLLPYLLVIGPRDAENGTVSIRDRYNADLGAISVTEAIATMGKEVDEKTVRQHGDDFWGKGDNN